MVKDGEKSWGGRGSDEARVERSVRQRESGWVGVTTLCIELEKFIVYHYIYLEIPPNWASPQWKRNQRKEKLKKKKKLSETSSTWWAKKNDVNIFKKLKFRITQANEVATHKIDRIMNNYCEFPAPTITCVLINKDLIIELCWRISAALINLAEKRSPQWPPVMNKACPESARGWELRVVSRFTTIRCPATVTSHTQEGHNFFR